VIRRKSRNFALSVTQNVQDMIGWVIMKGRGYYFSTFSRNIFYVTEKCIISNPILKKKNDKSSEKVKSSSSLLLHELYKYIYFLLCFVSQLRLKKLVSSLQVN
jgi:hypothetical protein